MRKPVGIGLVVVGIFMTVFGLRSADSLNSRLSRLLSEWPTDRAMWLLIGGVLAVVVGLALSSYRRKGST